MPNSSCRNALLCWPFDLFRAALTMPACLEQVKYFALRRTDAWALQDPMRHVGLAAFRGRPLSRSRFSASVPTNSRITKRRRRFSPICLQLFRRFGGNIAPLQGEGAGRNGQARRREIAVFIARNAPFVQLLLRKAAPLHLVQAHISSRRASSDPARLSMRTNR